MLAGILISTAAIVIPVVLVVTRDGDNGGGSGSGSTNGADDSPNDADDGGSSGPNTPQLAITGGDGSEVTMEDGTTFIYENTFGGYWVSDPDNPWNNDARPNAWTPPLNTSWDYSRDRIFG